MNIDAKILYIYDYENFLIQVGMEEPIKVKVCDFGKVKPEHRDKLTNFARQMFLPEWGGDGNPEIEVAIPSDCTLPVNCFLNMEVDILISGPGFDQVDYASATEDEFENSFVRFTRKQFAEAFNE